MQARLALQKLAADGKAPFAEPVKPPAPPKRAALLFVDGLRLDLAQQLGALLRAKGATATWVALGRGFRRSRRPAKDWRARRRAFSPRRQPMVWSRV
jgi:hypothetical protein